jgi:hypothetical protein
MRKSGFAQTIKGDNGAEFELPHGEYIFEGEIPVGDVMTLARRAAEAVWPDVYILVSESTGRSWFLKMIKAAKAQPV